MDSADEGYSEAPLNTSISPSKAAEGSSPGRLPSRDLSSLLLRHMSELSLANKTQLAMALLDDLPTSVIAEIVQRLNPRLYIDFIMYLPAEICLKILGYLDPLSLINVAKTCRAWYNLAQDRKLWEKIYFREGWKVVSSEIQVWEGKVNSGLGTASSTHLHRLRSSEDGHTYKKRAIAEDADTDGDTDLIMVDADQALRQEPGDIEMTEGLSLFGGAPTSDVVTARTCVTPRLGDLNMNGSSSSHDSRVDSLRKGKAKVVDKGKGRAISSTPLSLSRESSAVKPESLPELVPASDVPGAIAKSTLWNWESSSNRYRINWKYLHSMRHRLEANWDEAKFANFQFPHPEYPSEGHNECIYSLQFNSEYLVSGSRDRTIRVWDMQTRRLVMPPLQAHNGSVLCLQFDSDPEEDIIVSGSSDSDVIIWKFSTGQMIQRLKRAHAESVLNVKFDKRILVTCSKDKTIKIFNRRPMSPGDVGYGEPGRVYPVGVQVKNYGGYDDLDLSQLPIKPPYSMIGSLIGHGAAVNAVQICGNEVVSASGDRNLKIWDWPTQHCLRTYVGHSKGIACVQYDGKRIVSGSSDNEVKVFDRQTGLEVASLRAHTDLVRTVQAGFADLPYSDFEDLEEAKKVDRGYFDAVVAQTLPHAHARGRPGNAGSRRPEDITAFGAKLPPGGGGGRYARIVSGSYDQSIIIWRRDKDGVWKKRHHLKQEEAAEAAGPITLTRQHQQRQQQQQQQQQRQVPPPVSMHQSLTSAAAPPHAHVHVQEPAGTSAAAAQSATDVVSALRAQRHLESSTPGGLGHASSSTAAVAGSSHPPSSRGAAVAPATGSSSAAGASSSSAAAEGNPSSSSGAAPLGPLLNSNSADFAALDAPLHTALTPSAAASLSTLIDRAVPEGVQALQQALTAHPTMLALQPQLQAAIDSEPSPFVRSQLRQAVSTAIVRSQLAQARAHREHLAQLHSQSAAAIARARAAAGGPSPSPSLPAPSAVTSSSTSSALSARPGPTSAISAPPVLVGGSGPASGSGSGGDAAVNGMPPQMDGVTADNTTAPPNAGTTAAVTSGGGHPSTVAGRPPPPPAATTVAVAAQTNAAAAPQPTPAGGPPPPPQAAAAQPHHPHIPNADPPTPVRVFKLQFDVRRIVCCSQTSVIVGWDFCNGDPELEEASRFFSTVE